MYEATPAVARSRVGGLGVMRVLGCAALPMLAGLAGCVTDPFCRAHNAAEFAPTTERFGRMTPRERREDSERFNELARRCGWEP